MSNITLKPCPFCRSDDVDAECCYGDINGQKAVQAGCHSCDALGPAALTLEEAAAKWNDRPGLS